MFFSVIFILNSDSFQRKSWFKRIAKNAGYSWLAIVLFDGWPAGYQPYDAGKQTAAFLHTSVKIYDI